MIWECLADAKEVAKGNAKGDVKEVGKGDVKGFEGDSNEVNEGDTRPPSHPPQTPSSTRI